VPIRRAVGHARLDEQGPVRLLHHRHQRARAMEQALRASEQQFRSLIGNIPGISYRSLRRRRARWCSSATRSNASPATPQRFRRRARARAPQLRRPDPRRRPRARAEAIATALREDRPYLVEYRLLHADGSTRWLWENGTGVRNDAGKLHWLDGVILDITERREMEERCAKRRKPPSRPPPRAPASWPT
jgi:PAS domain-containing protein